MLLGYRELLSDQKIVAALRQLNLCLPADDLVEYSRLSESTCAEALKRICEAVCASLRSRYLILSTQSNLVDIERVYAQLGFPGAIGCVDCASWEWDACPVAWQGNHKGKLKKPCNRMEIVCDDYLYIWHVMFGTPGSKNDINSLHYSTLFNKIRTGAWPPCRPETVISGMPLTWYYYLVDGIYPGFQFSSQHFPIRAT
jgi:Plant transposon protein